jgi:3-phenylpropionate/cinnamic acid dioxygenase small subunit
VTSAASKLANNAAGKSNATTRQDVRDLFDDYVTYLDESRFDDWLGLFTDDCAYTMLLHRDYVKDTNMVAIADDKRRLAGRIEVGKTVERDLRTHFLTAVRVAHAGPEIRASANFAVLRKGAVACSGRYHMTLLRAGGDLKIKRCTVVLNDDVIQGTIYLPV